MDPAGFENWKTRDKRAQPSADVAFVVLAARSMNLKQPGVQLSDTAPHPVTSPNAVVMADP